MTARSAFALAAGAVLVVLILVLVVQPAVERGGWGEVVLVAAAFVLALAVERWLRTR
ncbi:MAG: hypothetical protein HYX56_06610 [Chloroflexi bacterium]|nr:hypothetical protein [Chloroflexota bacterium]